jgi:hypothetical protein
MKVLALEIPVSGAAAEAFQPLLVAEAVRAWELQQEGVIREIYFRGRPARFRHVARGRERRQG